MEKIKIKKMPTKKLLEEFLEGLFNYHQVTVLFDINKGKFIK